MQEPGEGSLISVIVPTYNREAQLRLMLESLVAQVCEACRFEVIVVADGCTDGTAELVSAVATRSRIPVRLEALQSNGGGAAAMNLGAEVARGDILLYLDDDLRCQPGLIAAHLDAHMGGVSDVVIGHTPLGPRPTLSFFRKVIYEWTEGWTASLAGRDVSYYDTLCSGHFSIRRDLFRRCGGFDERLLGWGRKDSELGYRLLAVGAKFGFAPRAVAAQDYAKMPSQFLGDFGRQGPSDRAMCYLHSELRPTVLLSRFHQAPWPVLAARRWAVSEPDRAVALVENAGAVFDELHRAGAQGMLLEAAFWCAADLAYWTALRRELGETRFAAEIGHPVPILLYHRIVPDGHEVDAFSVRQSTFRRHLDLLRREGYRNLSLRSFVETRLAGHSLPPRSVVLTFDDGLWDFLSAADLLEEHGYSATLFVPTAFMGANANWGGEVIASEIRLLDADEPGEALRAFRARDDTQSALRQAQPALG